MYLITVFENTLHEVHEDPIGMIFDFLLAEKLVREALLKDNPDSTINKYDIAEVNQTSLEIINPSVCYTNENISYTIYKLKEIKEVSDLKYGK